MSAYPLQFLPGSATAPAAERQGLSTPTPHIATAQAYVEHPRVLLCTTCHLPSSARLAMELAHAGAQVALVSPADHPARHTKAGKRWFNYNALHPLRSLRHAIESAEPDLLIPCDERAVRHLHALHGTTPNRTLAKLIERSLGSAAGYPTVTARHELLTLARSAGVRTATSTALRSVADLHALAQAQAFPWVLKADGSWAGLGVRIVRDLAEAEAAYREMIQPVRLWLVAREALLERDMFWLAPWVHRQQPAMSVQTFIDGWPANCAVACWQGEVLAGVCAESVTTETQTGPSTVARVIDNAEMLNAARIVVRKLGCSGLVGFDFMLEAGTGNAHLIEMNPRVTPICTVRLGRGRDLVEALLARVAGRPPNERPPVTERDMIVFFPHTWRQDPTNVYLQAGYHDVPWEEPALVRALMRPELRDRYWYTRGLRHLWLTARRARTRGV
jgi:biotin carboxylase